MHATVSRVPVVTLHTSRFAACLRVRWDGVPAARVSSEAAHGFMSADAFAVFFRGGDRSPPVPCDAPMVSAFPGLRNCNLHVFGLELQGRARGAPGEEGNGRGEPAPRTWAPAT